VRRAAGVLALLLGATLARAGDEPPLPEVGAALGRIAGRSTVDLTTVGRKTGREHTRPVWFVVADGKILVQAGKDGKSDWYQNLRKNPAAVLRVAGFTFRTRAVPVTDPARVEEIHRLFLRKYTSAWVLSFFGSSIGRGQPVELAPWSVVVQRDG
jgi:deazaflavin-dependent oxidoreductase (nitroreductase family)